MADAKDKKPDPTPPAPEQAAPAPPKKGPKMALVVAGVMVLEGVGVYMIAKMTSPKAAEAAVDIAHGEGDDDSQATVEIPLIEERFQNMQTGQIWVWDTEIVLKVKKKNEETVRATLDSKAAEIKEGVSAIFRRAQLNQLKEPGLETLNRQLMTYVGGMVGKDPEGHDRIERILVPKCRGFAAN
jgi:flagellar basal body-associated protein FliL